MYNNAERIGMDTKRLAMPLCRENRKTIKDHQFSTYANFFKKKYFLPPDAYMRF